ncbi:Sorting and assembly machinery component 50-like protein [Sciurus carolinensis]|uniref:Sorting and assembly machinery component 50-like protein n=1 Tax=Sciurus carolinensis TaxID=30640 RepID=A0AA41NC98_SCICA|nr:Sorting and assembly machinery component 50-like protein [Sciurus carolinensis]
MLTGSLATADAPSALTSQALVLLGQLWKAAIGEGAMGTVHAQSLEPPPSNGPDLGALGEEVEFVEVEPEAKQEIMENKDMIVQHVHFKGLGRTRDDVIMYEIGDVFKARNLIEVMRKSHEASEKLLYLGIFGQVNILIHTCQGDDTLHNGLDVTFELTELRRLMGSYNTMDCRKSVFEFSYGTEETSYGLSFFKPQPGNFKRNLSVNMYKVTGQFLWSSLWEADRGVSTEYSVPIWKSSHNRQVGGRVVGAWLPLQDGIFLGAERKWAFADVVLSRAMVINSGKSSILPKRGALLKVNQEWEGYNGRNMSFLKEDFKLQLNKQLVLDLVFSASLWGGMFVHSGEKPPSIADRFYLGGPTSIRGLSIHSIGTQSEGDYLGGEGYLGRWPAPVHPTALPARLGSFGELFRTHFFLNVGNLCNLNYREGPRAPIHKLAKCTCWSYGVATLLAWISTTVSPWECSKATGYVKACSLELGYGSYSCCFLQRSLGTQAAGVTMPHAFRGRLLSSPGPQLHWEINQ